MKTRNYVAKNCPKTGTGVHTDKHGKKSPRCKQKQQWRKDVKNW